MEYQTAFYDDNQLRIQQIAAANASVADGSLLASP